MRSDWVIAQLMRQHRLDNSFSPDFHGSGTFERHVTRYDCPKYRAIGKLRAGESPRVVAPLGSPVPLGASGDEKPPSITVTGDPAGSMPSDTHLF